MRGNFFTLLSTLYIEIFCVSCYYFMLCRIENYSSVQIETFKSFDGDKSKLGNAEKFCMGILNIKR